MMLSAVYAAPIQPGHEAAACEEASSIGRIGNVRIEPYAQPGTLTFYVEAPDVEDIRQAFTQDNELTRLLDAHTGYDRASWRKGLSLEMRFIEQSGAFSQDNRQSGQSAQRPGTPQRDLTRDPAR